MSFNVLDQETDSQWVIRAKREAGAQSPGSILSQHRDKREQGEQFTARTCRNSNKGPHFSCSANSRYPVAFYLMTFRHFLDSGVSR